MLLTLDVARRTGVAWGDLADAKPSTIVWQLPLKDRLDPVGRRVASLENTLGPFLDKILPFRVVMAERFPSRNMGEAAASFALDGIVRSECWRRGIKVLVQPESTMRKEVVGRGGGPTDQMKSLVKDWCTRMGIEFDDDNAADAALVWEWSRRELTKGKQPVETMDRARNEVSPAELPLRGVTKRS